MADGASLLPVGSRVSLKMRSTRITEGVLDPLHFFGERSAWAHFRLPSTGLSGPIAASRAHKGTDFQFLGRPEPTELATATEIHLVGPRSLAGVYWNMPGQFMIGIVV
jgi:hypothetical protein